MHSLQRIFGFGLCRLSTTSRVSRQICSLKKMNPSRKPISSSSDYSSFTAQNPFGNESAAEETTQSSGAKIMNEKQFRCEENFPPLSVNIGSSSKGRNFNKWGKRTDSGLELRQEAVNSSEFEGITNAVSLQEEHSLLNRSRTGINSGLQSSHMTVNLSEHEDSVNVPSLQEYEHERIAKIARHSLPRHFGQKKVYPGGVVKKSEGLPVVERFNICLPGFRDIKTREVLRPGMVLLKHYISIREQSGGFYRPGYKDGAKLRLHMMCLGMNWDPQTRKYNKQHPVDNCEPPDIPLGFRLLVQRAIKDAHCLIEKESDMVNPEDILPSISPNICIANFYSIHGRLGLHQDRDESRESLRKGLSIGDSAEFLYGDEREVDQASKVLLESGDVLLFGGESRMVFHGVPSIVPFSAPEPLKSKTGLRHGRLNLTFRQF
ncbi:hypothetical protein ES319_A10G159500v1 [Gossypium barbadense]|uniref:Fe2OG dioxygenase domain-containing protein n=2 Tax=Gossypium TaxID=3633 RepID=A0A5J5U5N0_GOSBA|nr:hypothetical protein ES319_A10G159500v1 [Gossypium barbadense]TYG99214.1 hypothetical protein ES288_A10G178400v1 [Gossypium darwinii]